MQLQEFIETMEPEFEDIKAGTLQPETEFRNVEGWSSMLALILIARIDEVYGVLISAEALAQATTVEDLFTLVQQQ